MGIDLSGPTTIPPGPILHRVSLALSKQFSVVEVADVLARAEMVATHKSTGMKSLCDTKTKINDKAWPKNQA